MNAQSDDYLFGKRQTWWILSLFCVLMIFDCADRMVIAAVLPRIKETWALTDAQSGMLSSALFFCMVLFALPTGLLIDRWSRTKTAGLMGGLWCLASGAGAFVASFPQLLVTRALVGMGEAGYFPASIAWLSAAFPQRRRQFALGLLIASQPIGTLVGLLAGSIIASLLGWRYALGILAVPGLVVSVLLYRSRDYRNIILAPSAQDVSEGTETAPIRPRHPRIREGLRLIAQTPSLWLIYLALAMLSLKGIPMGFFLPTFFTRVHGLSLQEAGYISSAVMLCPAIAGPLGGWFMDRKSQFKPENKIVFAIIAFGLGALLNVFVFGVVESLHARLALLLLSSFISCSAVPSILTVTQELVPQHRRALSSTCCVITGHLLGSVPGPWLAGLLSDRHGLASALLIMTVTCGTAMLVLLLIARKFYIRDFQRSASYRLTTAETGAAA